MTQTSKYVEEVQKLLATIDEPEKNDQEQQPPDTSQPLQEIDVYIEEDRITFIPKKPPQEQVIESTPVTPTPQKQSYRHIYALSFVYIFFLLAILMLQIWLVFHPPIATITLVAKSQTLTLTGTLQLGRVIAPITLTQSQAAPTTGRGHQDARNAVGTITFYNGLFSEQTIAAGTIFTGSDGVQVITDQTAYIPPESQTIPPTLGQATVTAHALLPSVRGNIPTGDINQPCCATAIKAVNTRSFSGGADERDFKIVTKNDINTVSTMLKTTLSASVTAALQAQLNPNEQLKPLPCTSTVTADHRVGQEATEVKVTASETCSAVAYNAQELASKATTLLTAQAIQTLGAGYSLIGEVHTTVTQATTQKQVVVLSFSSSGMWVYALTSQDQEHLKNLIAGKTKQEATALLTTLPGIKSASIAWEGKSKLPTDTRNIHLVIFVM